MPPSRTCSPNKHMRDNKRQSVWVYSEGAYTLCFMDQNSPFYLFNIEVYLTIRALARKRNCVFIIVALFWALTVLSRPFFFFFFFHSRWQILSRCFRRCLRRQYILRTLLCSCASSSSGFPFQRLLDLIGVFIPLNRQL